MGVFSWWLLPDLNWGHKALQASALPTELKSHIFGTFFETVSFSTILPYNALLGKRLPRRDYKVAVFAARRTLVYWYCRAVPLEHANSQRCHAI